jgi:DNA-3-methyladenine glycosylase I
MNNPLYIEYHDREWGRPHYDDQHLFEMLVLEGAQAGLSWETILGRRDGYRRVFHGFDVRKVAAMSDDDLQDCLNDKAIIRNRLKVFSARNNAKIFIEIQKEYGSFSDYLWGHIDGEPIQNEWEELSEIPAETKLSKEISKDLKKRGMSFVGPVIIYAYMQAIGMVNDHTLDCFCYQKAIEACRE